MNLKIKLFPKYAYLVSSTIALILFLYFAYKAFAAYLIHKELYGDGMDVLVSLRAALAGIMLLLIILFFVKEYSIYAVFAGVLISNIFYLAAGYCFVRGVRLTLDSDLTKYLL